MRSAEVGALGREDKHPIGKATMTYRAPVADISFALNHAAGFAPALADGLYGDLGDDVVEAVLTEAGKFATDILAPLNVIGDRDGARFDDGAVTTPPGWKEAYHAWAKGGWNALAAPAQWGGQDLPHALNAACLEMWNSAAMAFGLGPVLTMAAIDALAAHGSEELKRAYLPKLVSGEWMGTMQLTEPQAGSDVGALRTRAERAPDASWIHRERWDALTPGEQDVGVILPFPVARQAERIDTQFAERLEATKQGREQRHQYEDGNDSEEHRLEQHGGVERRASGLGTTHRA